MFTSVVLSSIESTSPASPLRSPEASSACLGLGISLFAFVHLLQFEDNVTAHTHTNPHVALACPVEGHVGSPVRHAFSVLWALASRRLCGCEAGQLVKVHPKVNGLERLAQRMEKNLADNID